MPEKSFGLETIKEYLPHRPPILLVDEVVDWTANDEIHARRTFTESDPVFQGHFPGNPLLPGVLGVEALAQAAALMVNLSMGTKQDETSFLFAAVDNTKFKKSIHPKDTVDLKVKMIWERRSLYRFEGKAFVNGAVVTETTFTAKLTNNKKNKIKKGLDRSEIEIHPQAVVDSRAKLFGKVKIGAFCQVGPYVQIGNGTELKSHVVIDGHTIIGEDNTIYPFAAIGLQPQDKKYDGEVTRLVIGNGNTIREYVTMQPGTIQDRSETRIGDDNLFMALTHVAHDCLIGNNCVLANGATLAGHVEVGDSAVIGGLSAIHQFVKIGAHAMIGGHSAIDRDVLPFSLAMGERARHRGLNLVGLRRRQLPRKTIRALQDSYKKVFDGDDGFLKERLQSISNEFGSYKEVEELVAFVERSSRGLLAEGQDDG